VKAQYRFEEVGVDGMIILKCKYVGKAWIVFISLKIWRTAVLL
jgi:hypothetical protein